MSDPAAAAPVTLSEMLQRLVRERGTGVLRVQGREGWKILEIQSGAVHLVTGTEGKRLRLGDILVARGKIKPKELQRALDAQKGSGKPLGEVLAGRGVITRSEIQDVVRFQIEEEIYDLFTWKGAQCTFEPNSTLGPQIDGYPDVMRLSIDPQRILTEAARRIPIWQRIGGVIRSTNMSFRLTDRGRAMLDTATRSGRKLLDLVEEGYSVDFIVKKSMVGRFAIWNALADLVEAQAAVAIPDAELEQLATGWESEGKLEQVLGAYLQLAEVTTDRIKNGEYRGKVRVLRDEIAAIEAEEQEAAPAVGRAERRDIRTLVLTALIVLIVIGAAVYVVSKVRGERSGDDLGRYHEFRARATELAVQGNLVEAWEVLDKYLAQYPDGAGAELAKSARARIIAQYERRVEIEIGEALALEKKNRFAEAIALYDDISARYPLTKKHTRIAGLRAKAETDSAEYIRKLTRQQLADTLKRGRELLAEKRFSESMSYLKTVVNSHEAGHELRNEARKLLEVVKEAEEKAEALIRKAQALERKGSFDQAILVYRECFELWGKSRSGRMAANRLTELGQNRARAERLYENALRRYAEGDFTGAVGGLRKAARYKGYRVAGLAEQKLEDLAAANKRSAELQERARRLERRGLKKEAFKTLVELVERYPHTLAARDTRVEVRIESVPAGARAWLDGKGIGSTPLTLKVSPSDAGTIKLTRPGFVTLEKRFEDVRSPVIRLHLQREVLFRKNVGRPIYASPVRVGDRMLVRSGELLTLFLIANGAPVRQIEVGPPPNERVRPAVAEDTVYAAGGGSLLTAYSLSTGARRAEYEVPSPVVTTPFPIRLSLLAGRLFVIAGCRDGEVVSLDATTGRVHWSVRVPPPIRFDLVVTDRAVVVASPGGRIVAFDVLRGDERWREDVPGEVAGDLAVDAAGERVAAITSLGEVYVFSVAEGGKLMRTVIDGIHGGGIVFDGERIYVGGDDGHVRALDAQTGRVLWDHEVDGPVRDEPVVYSGTVYVGTEAGSIVSLDAETGAERWRLDAAAPVTAAGLAAGGRLVFGTHDGEVIGLDVSSAPGRRR